MNSKYHVLTIALVSSLVFGCSTSSSPSYPIDDFSEVPRLLEFHDVPGVSIATIKDFEIDQVLVFGVKNTNTLDPVTPDTLFQAASMSKLVAAIGAMSLSQNGVIDIDADINNDLISWRVEENQYTADEDVTMRRLLSHTAGTNVWGFPGYNQNDTIPTEQDILSGQFPANTEAVVVQNRPGDQFRYSGGGYVLAQLTMMDVTQQSFEGLMSDTVLEPLVMTSSSFNQYLSEDRKANISAGHDFNGQNIPGDYHLYPEMSAAGLWTTPQDLAKLLIELQLSLLNQSHKVLTGDLVKEMITPVGGPVFNKPNEFYGIGFQIWGEGEEYLFGHGGANEGFISRMAAHTHSGTGYVIMTNGNNGELVIREIIRLIEKAQSRENT